MLRMLPAVRMASACALGVHAAALGAFLEVLGLSHPLQPSGHMKRWPVTVYSTDGPTHARERKCDRPFAEAPGGDKPRSRLGPRRGRASGRGLAPDGGNLTRRRAQQMLRLEMRRRAPRVP